MAGDGRRPALVAGIRAGSGPRSRGRSRSSSPSRPDHRAAARELLTELAVAGRAGRDPGRHLGRARRRQVDLHRGPRQHLTAAGHRVGVLAVDPSSVRTGGSVLGDKTRMARAVRRPERLHPALARAPAPSAASPAPPRRRCWCSRPRAYDVVLVETVGVGQSEITVAGMVDTFLFLTLARTGDQLQGIKKGILEIADVIAVNKADGDREQEARVGRPRARRRAAPGARRTASGRRRW